MSYIRPRYVEKCILCGEEFDKAKMREIFTGRIRYICPACDARGNRQIAAKQTDWRKTYKGKVAIEHCRKKK